MLLYNQIMEEKILEYLKKRNLIVSTKTKARGHLGFYSNEKIAISKNLPEEKRLSVIIHEFAHKIHSEIEPDKFSKGGSLEKLFHVINADTKENARTLAKSVICSSLTKAMIYGHDANFGRILCALGYSGVLFDPDKVELTIESEDGSVLLYKNGEPLGFDEEYATKVLSAKEVIAKVDMHAGSEEASAWGCDLTYDYVKINADYRS